MNSTNFETLDDVDVLEIESPGVKIIKTEDQKIHTIVAGPPCHHSGCSCGSYAASGDPAICVCGHYATAHYY